MLDGETVRGKIVRLDKKGRGEGDITAGMRKVQTV